MRGTSFTRIFTSIGAVAALSLGAVSCSSDDESADTTASTATTVSDSSVATDATTDSSTATTESTTDSSTATTDSTTDSSSPTTVATTVSSNSGNSDDDDATSDNLDDYIDALASDTDNFDELTTTPEDTRCAAAAILTPIGVEVLQREGISVDDVSDDLDLTEDVTAEAAAGIADGLVACGLAIPFAASLAEGETTEDLDDAQERELFECVSAALDEESARETLNGFLSPSGVADPSVAPSRYTAGVFLTGLIRDCGFEATVYP